MEKKSIIIISIIIAIFLILFFIINLFFRDIIPMNSNCGTSSYKFDVKIESKEDFLNFLQNEEYTKQMAWMGSLDSFKDINKTMKPNEIETAKIDWKKVEDSIEVREKTNWWIFKEKEYVINYKPMGCGGYTLTMSPSGKVILNGCCGI